MVPPKVYTLHVSICSSSAHLSVCLSVCLSMHVSCEFNFTPDCVSLHSCVVYPLATSTPRVAYITAENSYKENRPLEPAGQPGQVGLATIRESVTSGTDTDRSSTGSDLTHISTSDISSHGDEESDHENLNANMNNATEVVMPIVPLQLLTTGTKSNLKLKLHASAVKHNLLAH